jgi:hypothetical protein
VNKPMMELVHCLQRPHNTEKTVHLGDAPSPPYLLLFLRYKKKAPPVAEPSQRLIPLDLSLGADAEYNAFDACRRTGGGSVSSLCG